MNESAEDQIRTLFYAEPAEVRAGEMNLISSRLNGYHITEKEDGKIPSSFAPAPKESLLEILHRKRRKSNSHPLGQGK